MTLPTTPERSRTTGVRTALTAAIVGTALATIPSAAHADIGTPVPLGAGASFAVLAYAGVTSTGTTVVGGDVGSFPTASVPGSLVLVDGAVNHGGDVVTQQAKLDLVTAYGSASSQTPDPLAGVELAGLTLEPGVYDTGGVIELNGNLTLDANGDPAAVFIFQSTATLLAGAGSSITFVDGATACNLYWRVPSSAAIQAGAQFAGTILAEATIAFGAGATLTGRAMSQSGQVTLIGNTIDLPDCTGAGAPGAPTPTPTVPVPTVPAPGGPVVGAPDGAAAAAAPASARQVPVVPRGGIAAGDGSSTTAADRSALVTLTLAGFTAAALLVTRARRRQRG
ncbi:ice-binding family protein [Cellulomonas fengjieae]|uniref:ice-binding family protein n=1 Tax=Cellulomonas fengjieae TaxID=2819978 RepID=UPI001AAF7AFC|nr:ice-binding family protein [Cellulomonas fengjieae]MBO3100382.1 DUF3494 domain-containing protein [Cellulomonas fengjieae]